jgi:hypothetical protein
MKKIACFLLFITLLILQGCEYFHESKSADVILYERLYCPEDNEYWYDVDNDNHTVYSISKKNESKTVLYQTEKTQYLLNAIDITDENIYFLILETESENDEQVFAPFKICTIKKDGTDFSVLITRQTYPFFEGEVVRDLRMYNNKYMFLRTNDRSLFLYNVETTKIELVEEYAQLYRIYNQKIYFISDWSLYSMDLNLQNKEVILQAETDWDKSKQKELISNFYLIEDEIFYFQRSPEGIYRYRSGERSLITDNVEISNDASLFVYNGKLYYSNSPDNKSALMCYDPKTEKHTVILSGVYFRLPAIIDGYLYYIDSEEQVKWQITETG